ncbi:MAG: hypothetical protein ACRDA7_01165 [Metamycoplasmataceae bacterium]
MILWSCVSAGVISAAAITTVAVLIPIKNNVRNPKNLNITPKEGVSGIFQSDIGEMTSTTNTALDRAFAISKVFDGVTESNVIHILAEEGADSTIVLTAQEDYFFNSEDVKTLNSSFRIVEIIEVLPMTGVISLSQEDFDIIFSTTSTPTQKVAALSNLFEGVTEANLVNFTIDASDTKITLIANDGFAFAFETSPSISVEFYKIAGILNITVKPGTISVSDADVSNMISISNSPQKVAALSKVFDGINELNIVNIKAEKTSNNKITLRSNPGFYFGTSETTQLTANISIVQILNITTRTTVPNITEEDIAAMLSTTNSLAQRVAALSKLFDGITESNVGNFTVERTGTVIALKAKPGFAFGSTLADSLGADINKVITVLNIKPKTGTINVSQAEVDAMASTSNTAAEKAAALLKLFDGVTEGDVDKFTVEKAANSITLKAKEGFAFGFISTTSISANYQISTILDIKAKAGTNNVTNQDILDMISISEIQKRITALSKVFDGINGETVNHVRAERTSEVTITLVATDGFFIGSVGTKSIRSSIRIVTILNISPKANIPDVTESDINAMTSTANQLSERVTALSKVFDGINIQNVINVRATKTSNTEITLNTINENFLFLQNNSTSIKANIKTITLLRVTPKSIRIDVTQGDIDNMLSSDVNLKLPALSKVFDGLTLENVNNVTAEKLIDTEIILRANQGFAFGDSSTFSIKAQIKLIILLSIKAKPGPINVTQADINNMVGSSNTADKVGALSKLFDGINNNNLLTFDAQSTAATEITLTARDGYAFGSINTKSIKATFAITTILGITPKQGINDITLEILNDIFSSVTTVQQKVFGLSHLFNGVTTANFDNFEIVHNSSMNQITLTVKPGSLFDNAGTTTISSLYKYIRILDITAKQGIINISNVDVHALFLADTAFVTRLRILNDLFDTVTLNNINNFKVERTSVNQISLRANPGWSFVTVGNPLITTEINIIPSTRYNGDEMPLILNDNRSKKY